MWQATGLIFLIQLAASPGSAPISEAETASGTAKAESIEDARQLLRNGEYDSAIESIKRMIAAPNPSVAALGESYLLLCSTYVQRANYYTYQAQSREVASLLYTEASEVAKECLLTKGLQHIRPDPLDYPEQMVRMFDDARKENLGSFRVASLAPVDATLLLDGDTLAVDPVAASAAAEDILAGIHTVVVKRAGFRDIVEKVSVPPGVTIDRAYTLSKKPKYMVRTALIAGAIATVAVLWPPGTPPGGAEQPLPTPPGTPEQ